MFPIALFPLLALCTYDWHDISALSIPAASPTANLIGVVGAWFAYAGYQLVGLAVWTVPVVCVYAGLRLVLGRSFHPGRRSLGVSLLVFAVTCLLQVAGTSQLVAPLLRSLNIEPNAGGAVGYLVMTRCLAYHLAPFGASVLMISLAVFSLFLVAGPRNIVSGIARLTDWAADRDRDEMGDLGDRDAEKAAARAAKEAEREAERIAREERRAAKEAEREAREAAKRREEEEKAALRARLKAERETPAAGPVDYMPPRDTPAARPAAPVVTPVRTVAQPPTLAASGGRIRARSESSAPSVPLAETP